MLLSDFVGTVAVMLLVPMLCDSFVAMLLCSDVVVDVDSVVAVAVTEFSRERSLSSSLLLHVSQSSSSSLPTSITSTTHESAGIPSNGENCVSGRNRSVGCSVKEGRYGVNFTAVDTSGFLWFQTSLMEPRTFFNGTLTIPCLTFSSGSLLIVDLSKHGWRLSLCLIQFYLVPSPPPRDVSYCRQLCRR